MTTLSRRSFIQSAVAASAVGAVVPRWATLVGATPLAANEGMLVVLTLRGGCDSLSLLVPKSGERRSAYELARGGIALDPATLLPATVDHGLNPNLPFLAQRFAAGDVAVIDGVGMPPNLRSHFVSEAVVQAASITPSNTGWLGRHLDGYVEGSDELMSVAVAPTLPLHLRGSGSHGTSMPRGMNIWGDETVRFERTAHDAIRAFSDSTLERGPWADSIAATGSYAIDKAVLAGSLISSAGGSGLERDMEFAALVLNADIGTRVVAVEVGGYDTHASQQAGVATLFGQLDRSIEKFWAKLDAERHGRVSILVVSEFGRKLHVNSSRGTDHGHAGIAMAIGPNVAGGLHSEHPSLVPDTTDSLVPTIDLRHVYGSLIDDWLAGDSADVLGGQYTALDLFAAPPGSTL